MLLSELRFWTTDGPGFGIKETPDLAVFSYVAEKSKIRDVYVEGKELYSISRGTKYVIDNKKPHRLKRNLKKLETELRSQSIVHCEWIFANIVQIMLSNGLLAYVILNSLTSDVVHIGFDKYFIGKLVSPAVHNGKSIGSVEG